MRGSSPRQKKQKGSSGFSPRPPASPEPLAGAGTSFTRSMSQSAQRVNPRRYPALHCGQYITAGVYYKKHVPRMHCDTVHSTPLFSSVSEIIRKGRKSLYLNTVFVT